MVDRELLKFQRPALWFSDCVIIGKRIYSESKGKVRILFILKINAEDNYIETTAHEDIYPKTFCVQYHPTILFLTTTKVSIMSECNNFLFIFLYATLNLEGKDYIFIS